MTGIINTYSGIEFNILNPTPEMIYIEDIAKGLANKGHFGGLTPFYFSIAQHSILVYDLAYNSDPKNTELLLLALLHDASEAYIGDMLKPIKDMMPQFCKIENDIMKVICEKYDLDYSKLFLIKTFDNIAQDMEFKTFYNNDNLVHSLSPYEAENQFLDLFNSIICVNNNQRHPKCKGWYKNDWGMIDGADFGCDYKTTIDCDECLYGGGGKNPEDYPPKTIEMD